MCWMFKQLLGAGEGDMHTLKIKSLRDLRAECSCGGWSMHSPHHKDDTDTYLRQLAHMGFVSHIGDRNGILSFVEHPIPAPTDRRSP